LHWRSLVIWWCTTHAANHQHPDLPLLSTANNIMSLFVNSHTFSAFSALTLLDGDQEGHPAGKNLNRIPKVIQEETCGRAGLTHGDRGSTSQVTQKQTDVRVCAHLQNSTSYCNYLLSFPKRKHSLCSCSITLENMCHNWALLRWCFTTKRRYIKCMHLYLTFYYKCQKHKSPLIQYTLHSCCLCI